MVDTCAHFGTMWSLGRLASGAPFPDPQVPRAGRRKRSSYKYMGYDPDDLGDLNENNQCCCFCIRDCHVNETAGSWRIFRPDSLWKRIGLKVIQKTYLDRNYS